MGTMPTTALTDPDIRRGMEMLLPAGALIRHEMGICNTRGRADIAAITKSFMVGWEIKSDVDSLVRLPGQVINYSQVMDQVTLVATARHLDVAAQLVPDWWGLLLASPSRRSGVRVTSVRKPKHNTGHDPMALASLLWREEAMSLLSSLGHSGGLGKKSRWYVWERLVEVTTTDQLRKQVRNTLLNRHGW